MSPYALYCLSLSNKEQHKEHHLFKTKMANIQKVQVLEISRLLEVKRRAWKPRTVVDSKRYLHGGILLGQFLEDS